LTIASTPTSPVTIVGGGLAGSWLAWWLVHNGCSVSLIDSNEPSTSSLVAAGLVNPITGPRYQATWQGATLLPWMADAYRSVERATGAAILRETRLWRVIRDADSLRRVRQRLNDGEYDWMNLRLVGAGSHHGIDMPFGAVDVQAYTVNTIAFVDAIQQWLQHNGATVFTRAVAHNEDLLSTTVWATGWHAARDNRWRWLPFSPVRGDILDVSIPDLDLPHVVTGRVWIVPQGGNLYRLGATYDWDRLDSVPHDVFRNELLDAAAALLGPRPIHVLRHAVGIRPAVLPRRPIVGQHPAEPNHYILNGLGTKGASLAPWAANALANHLAHGTALPVEIDIAHYPFPTNV
jgi:glycine oxidase